MKITVEVDGDKWKYSVWVTESSNFTGESKLSIDRLILFTEIVKGLNGDFCRQDKWETDLEAIRRLVEKEKEAMK